MKFTGLSLAQEIKFQNRHQFSFYQVNDIQIHEQNDEPELLIKIHQKLNLQKFELLLIAEKQDHNPNNVHLTLLNNQPEFRDWYQKERGNYVNANHQTADQIKDTTLVPENLYLIQDADGRPGIDFIHSRQFTDAMNTLMLISNQFEKNIEAQK